MTAPIEEKECSRCHVPKPLDDFYTGRASCKVCCNKATVKCRNKSKEATPTTLEKKLERMKGKTYMFISGFQKTVTGFQIQEKEVVIYTSQQASLKPVIYPIKKALNKINKEFLTIQR